MTGGEHVDLLQRLPRIRLQAHLASFQLSLLSPSLLAEGLPAATIAR